MSGLNSTTSPEQNTPLPNQPQNESYETEETANEAVGEVGGGSLVNEGGLGREENSAGWGYANGINGSSGEVLTVDNNPFLARWEAQDSNHWWGELDGPAPWGSTVTATGSGTSGGWGAADMNGGAWGSTATGTGRRGGWGAAETNGDINGGTSGGGWGANETGSGTGGWWGEPDTSGGGWGSNATGTGTRGGWGAAETNGDINGGTSGGGWGANKTGSGTGGGWGEPDTSGGGWGSNATGSGTSGWGSYSQTNGLDHRPSITVTSEDTPTSPSNVQDSSVDP